MGLPIDLLEVQGQELLVRLGKMLQQVYDFTICISLFTHSFCEQEKTHTTLFPGSVF